jgi:hypothetical protein
MTQRVPDRAELSTLIITVLTRELFDLATNTFQPFVDFCVWWRMRTPSAETNRFLGWSKFLGITWCRPPSQLFFVLLCCS